MLKSFLKKFARDLVLLRDGRHKRRERSDFGLRISAVFAGAELPAEERTCSLTTKNPTHVIRMVYSVKAGTTRHCAVSEEMGAVCAKLRGSDTEKALERGSTTMSMMAICVEETRKRVGRVG